MVSIFEKSNDGAVSESIGFMLIFTIIIAGIALVTLYGYPMLLEQQTSADEKIMEKNMIVLQNDFKSMAYKTVPYKETSLKIGSGSLTVYNSSHYDAAPTPPSFAIKYLGCPASSCESFKSGDLRYESVKSQTDISLQNGAVMIQPRYQAGSSMLAEPRWYYDTGTSKTMMVINLINITSDAVYAKEGIGTVRMKLVDTSYTLYEFTGGTVTVEYARGSEPGTDYSNAWNNYLENSLDMSCSGTDPLSCTKGPVDQLIIKKITVKIESF